MTAHANYSLRDEIRDYWSDRAETFDLQVGHEIFSEQERAAWHALISRHLGPGAGRASLDLACGTGVISHLMHDLGFVVTGLDWSEAMLAKARAKAQKRGAGIRFIIGDAERTLEDRASYDVIVTRHLVWTLLDPKTAFAEWFSLLKPGGKLLVIDGDFASRNWATNLRELWEKLTTGKSRVVDNEGAVMARRHLSILARVYFSGGARAEEIGRLLTEAGFEQPLVDWKLGAIHRAQARQLSWPKALERATQHRFAICATKPGQKSTTVPCHRETAPPVAVPSPVEVEQHRSSTPLSSDCYSLRWQGCRPVCGFPVRHDLRHPTGAPAVRSRRLQLAARPTRADRGWKWEPSDLDG